MITLNKSYHGWSAGDPDDMSLSDGWEKLVWVLSRTLMYLSVWSVLKRLTVCGELNLLETAWCWSMTNLITYAGPSSPDFLFLTFLTSLTNLSRKYFQFFWTLLCREIFNLEVQLLYIITFMYLNYLVTNNLPRIFSCFRIFITLVSDLPRAGKERTVSIIFSSSIL